MKCGVSGPFAPQLHITDNFTLVQHQQIKFRKPATQTHQLPASISISISRGNRKSEGIGKENGRSGA
jgi:hypothetical protein